MGTPPEIKEAIDRIAAYLNEEGYKSMVVSETGGASFQHESILSKVVVLHDVIRTLHDALLAADKGAVAIRGVIRDCKNLDNVFHILSEKREL